MLYDVCLLGRGLDTVCQPLLISEMNVTRYWRKDKRNGQPEMSLGIKIRRLCASLDEEALD